MSETRKPWHGVLVATSLQFNDDLSIDFGAYGENVAWLAEQGEALLLSVEEQNKVAMRLSRSGQVQFFGLKDGVAMNAYQLALPAGASIVSVVEELLPMVSPTFDLFCQTIHF